MWMTHISSRRKSTNRISYNTLTVLTLPCSLQWRTIRRMVPSPSWKSLLKQRLMGICSSLFTGNLPTQTSIYTGTATITSQQRLVLYTLNHRAQTGCSKPELLCKEMNHLRKALTQCKYPKWTLDKVGKRINRPSREVTDGANNQGTSDAQYTTNEVKTKGHIVIPYTQGLYESIKKICGRYDMQTHFKGGSTITNLLVSPKDKDPMISKSGAIYWFQCSDLTCYDEYIGESSRTYGERFKEHLKDSSPIHHHSNITGHPTSQNNFKIIGREGHGLARNIKESILLGLIIPH